jgi:hypothetical protein
MRFLIVSRIFVTAVIVTLCGPDGLHSHSYNTISVIPPGLSLDEAFAMVKKLQNAKENMPEESS